MKPYVELKIGENEYKLKMKTRQVVALEKSLGKSPLNILMEAQDGVLPSIEDMLMILAASLQQYHHGFDLDKVYDLYDEFVKDGNTMLELIPIIIDVLSVSGYIKMDVAKDE